MAKTWGMNSWETGKPLTFLEALGFSKAQFTFPQLKPMLPSASASSQHPIQVSGGSGGGGGGSGAGGQKPPPPKGKTQQYARKLMTQHSWTGANQWSSFVQLELSEAGWNPQIKNPKSGALGIAQALGHGNANTQGTLGNEYGGFGLTDKQAKEANSGNPYWQLTWMMNYISATYGDPATAWQFHQANNWY